jgi:hypothetical protein
MLSLRGSHLRFVTRDVCRGEGPKRQHQYKSPAHETSRGAATALTKEKICAPHGLGGSEKLYLSITYPAAADQPRICRTTFQVAFSLPYLFTEQGQADDILTPARKERERIHREKQ